MGEPRPGPKGSSSRKKLKPEREAPRPTAPAKPPSRAVRESARTGAFAKAARAASTTLGRALQRLDAVASVGGPRARTAKKKNIAARKRACRACSAERREQLRGALVLWKSSTRTAASLAGTPRNAPSLTLVDGVKGDDARASEAKRDSAAATPGDDAVEALLKPLKELARDGRRTQCEARQHDEAVYLLVATVRRRVRRVDERRPAPHQITVFTRHLPVLG